MQGYSWTANRSGLPGNQQSYFDFSGHRPNVLDRRAISPILLAACLDEARSIRMWQALQMTQREAFRVSPQYGQAMAWETITPATMGTDGPTIVDKPGGLNNASAYIGLVPERKIGIVILANRGDAPSLRSGPQHILPALSRMWVSGL